MLFAFSIASFNSGILNSGISLAAIDLNFVTHSNNSLAFKLYLFALVYRLLACAIALCLYCIGVVDCGAYLSLLLAWGGGLWLISVGVIGYGYYLFSI